MGRILAEVEIPQLVSVTSLASAELCMLRAFAAPKDQWALRTSPFAIRGQIFHLLQQRAVEAARNCQTECTAETLLDEIILEINARLRLDSQSSHLVPIETTAPLLEWVNVKRRMVRLATELLRESPNATPRSTGAGGDGRRYTSLHVGWHAEVFLASERLRLKGKIDYLEVTQNRIRIVDYKSGAVVDPDTNEVREEAATQLRLYALLVRELRPDAELQLIIRDGKKEWPVAWTEKSIAETESFIQKLMAFEAGTLRSSADLAATGAACKGCQVRQRCPGYAGFAPEQWRKPNLKLSWDTWGVVVKLERREHFVGVELRDAADRVVRVERVNHTHAPMHGLRPGDHISFFDFDTIERNSGYPRNFHELPRDPSQRRAWSATVFLD
ncbi:MAG: PD-(D/E)XK nuclease family protein [Thermoanaerobaculia bacterium]